MMEERMDEDDVRALARAAALPLEDGRLPALAALLGGWLPAANELSRAMSAPEHRRVLPVTVFGQPPTDPTE